MQLTTEQEKAVQEIKKWFERKDRTPYITLGGYAGTGKTTLVPFIIEALNNNHAKKLTIALCSYTGRAAQNLKNQLQAQDILSAKNKVSTIHGLIYNPTEDKNGVITGWTKKPEIEADCIIVDEASMVDGEIWQDLCSYKIPIIAIGDHGQLFPIKGNFSLMQKPDLIISNIHRQAQGNPIIEVATLARQTGVIPPKVYSHQVIKYAIGDDDYGLAQEELLTSYDENTLIICGYNKTRNQLNQYVRQALGFESAEPESSDRVVCLRNNHEKQVYNGMTGTIKHIDRLDAEWFDVEIEMDDLDNLYVGKIYAPQFNAPLAINFTENRIRASGGDLFDFGYALTVHKAQGSQAKRVILFEERFPKMDDSEWRRWLYTGVTRSEEELYLFGK